MLGKEVWLIDRAPKSGAEIPGISWFYPDTYAVGMSGLGYQLVWSLLKQNPETLVARGFTDCQQETAAASELFGFTLSWELDFVNIISILEKNGINARSSERGEDDAICLWWRSGVERQSETVCRLLRCRSPGRCRERHPPAFSPPGKKQENPAAKIAVAAEHHIWCLYPIFYRCSTITAAGPCRYRSDLDEVPKRLTKQLFTAPADATRSFGHARS